MTKYQQLIKKIEKLQVNPSPNYDLSQSEWELIEEALTTVQFLEVIFALRLRSLKSKSHV